jgi:hypothetical protein
MIGMILYSLALLCFVLAAVNVPLKNINLVALGLAFAVAPQVLVRFM